MSDIEAMRQYAAAGNKHLGEAAAASAESSDNVQAAKDAVIRALGSLGETVGHLGAAYEALGDARGATLTSRGKN